MESLDESDLSEHHDEIMMRLTTVIDVIEEPAEEEDDEEEDDDDDVKDISRHKMDHTALSPLLIDGSLPDEIFINVLRFVPWRSICTIARTCRKTRDMPTEEDGIWGNIWDMEFRYTERPDSRVQNGR